MDAHANKGVENERWKKQEQENESESFKVSARRYRIGKNVLFFLYVINLILFFLKKYTLAGIMQFFVFWVAIIVILMRTYRYRQLKLSFGNTHFLITESVNVVNVRGRRLFFASMIFCFIQRLILNQGYGIQQESDGMRWFNGIPQRKERFLKTISRII